MEFHNAQKENVMIFTLFNEKQEINQNRTVSLQQIGY